MTMTLITKIQAIRMLPYLSVKHDHDKCKLDLSHAKGNLINHGDDDFHHLDLTLQIPSSLKRSDFTHVNNDAKHDLDQAKLEALKLHHQGNFDLSRIQGNFSYHDDDTVDQVFTQADQNPLFKSLMDIILQANSRTLRITKIKAEVFVKADRNDPKTHKGFLVANPRQSYVS